MNLHPFLAERIAADCAEALACPPRLTQDALILDLNNDVSLTVRYAAADAYSLRWRIDPAPAGVELGIDTAPTHPALATVPNHFHRADGSVVADPVTRTDARPEDNLRRLVAALLHDPQLGGGGQ